MPAVILVFCWLLATGPVLAGAWLREEGTTFFSVGGDMLTGFGTVYRSWAIRHYAEHGLRPHLTVGTDVYARAEGPSQGLIFLRTDLFRRQNRIAVSVSGAVGLRSDKSGIHRLQRFGIAAGVPFRKAHRNGWSSVEVLFERQQGKPELTRKIDATFGLVLANRWRGLIDLSLIRDSGGYRGFEVTPRAAFRVNGTTQFVFGIKAARSGMTRTRGLSFDIWHEF